MAQTNVSFEMNEKLKDQMDEICEDLGMTSDEAFQIFAAKMVNEQGIPFEVTEKDYPASDEECLIKKACKIGAAVAGVIAAIGVIIALIKFCKRD